MMDLNNLVNYYTVITFCTVDKMQLAERIIQLESLNFIRFLEKFKIGLKILLWFYHSFLYMS